MKNEIVFLLFLFPSIGTSVFAQSIDVLKTGERKDLPVAEDFAYVESKTDSSGYSFVATYAATGAKKKGNITTLFFLIAGQAKKDGANCFKLSSFTRKDSLSEATLVLDTYYWNDSVRLLNFNNHPQNCIYIFGGEDPADDNTISFKIDNEKKVLRSGTYYKYIRTQGKEVKISKGGLSGMTMWYTLDGNKPNLYLTLTGLGLGGGSVPANVTGLSFNTGRIQPVPGDLGCLLTVLLKPAE